MGEVVTPAPVLLVGAATSRYVAAIEWARERGERQHGPVALVSEPFAFTETDYYTSSMGGGLTKQFYAFERLIDPAEFPAIKRYTNEWEVEYAARGEHPEPRPLNLDPGYITPAKLVLASTKDHAHRVYLRDGIYAEVTLAFRKRRWQPLEWTYPDYRRDDYQAFFTKCRDWLLNCGANRAAVK